jgi:hypothetical protein
MRFSVGVSICAGSRQIGDANALLSRFVVSRVLSAKSVRLSGPVLNAAKTLAFFWILYGLLRTGTKKFLMNCGCSSVLTNAKSSSLLSAKSERFDLGRFKHTMWAEANQHLLLLHILCQTDTFTTDQQFREKRSRLEHRFG